MTLSQDLIPQDSTYQDFLLTGTDGAEEIFNSFGQLYEVKDAAGNTTTYTYVSNTGPVNTIDGPSGQTTTFNYPSGPLSSIVYQASSNAAQLTTGIGISGGQLMSVTEPNPGVMGETQPVTNFTYYPGTDSLETKEDPDLNTTTYSYRYDGTLQTVANPDGSTLGYQSLSRCFLVPTAATTRAARGIPRTW